MYSTAQATVQIELELPRDVLFAMKIFSQPEMIQRKLKIALALLLFRENAISFGKAAEVANMSYGQFLAVLHEHGIAAYDCTEQECAWDDEAVLAYQQTVEQ
ncbi:UPF0175 family protein [Candidatus Electronema sp. PJ]|uniref:UPF0175 family protein n=1 Tax=Candidatus Electronema sp. PJ TaxID=3401572 RepID=UPI003AA9DAA8